MNFSFTRDQLDLRDTLGEVLSKEFTPERLREIFEGLHPIDQKAWGVLGEVGMFSLLAPQDLGGLGMGLVEVCLAAEELGRCAFVGPVVEHTCAVVGHLSLLWSLGLAGGDLLEGPGQEDFNNLVSGTKVATVQLRPTDPVAWGEASDLVLLCYEGQGPRLARGLMWDDPNRPRPSLGQATPPVAQVPARSVDHSYQLSWVDQGQFNRGGIINLDLTFPIDQFDKKTKTLIELVRQITIERCTLVVAGQLIGLADKMISMAVDYAKDRTQFQVTIGSNQAVKHHLANSYLALDHARHPVYYAAFNLDRFVEDLVSHSMSDDDIAGRWDECLRDVSFAKVYASRAARLAGKTSLQCHGAIGYSWEHDLHMYMKRSWALANLWGTVDFHLDRVTGLVLR